MPEIEVAKKFLKSKGVTYWVHWDITDDNELEDAAKWFLKLSMDYMEYCEFYFAEVQNLNG